MNERTKREARRNVIVLAALIGGAIVAVRFFGVGEPTPEEVNARQAQRQAAEIEREATRQAEAEAAERAEAEAAVAEALQAARQRAAEAEQREAGLHCLSSWNGAHIAFRNDVRRVMRDPSSFQHIETRITPVEDGAHTVVMRYRAANGFGGLNIGHAIAVVDHVDCTHTIISVE